MTRHHDFEESLRDGKERGTREQEMRKMSFGVGSSQKKQGQGAEAVEQVEGQGRDRPMGQLERQRRTFKAEE